MTFSINTKLKALTHIADDGKEYDGNWERRRQHLHDKQPWVWYATVWESAAEDANILASRGGRTTSEAKAIAAIQAWLNAQAATLESTR